MRTVDKYTHSNADLLGVKSPLGGLYSEHHDLTSKIEMRTKRNTMQIIADIKKK